MSGAIERYIRAMTREELFGQVMSAEAERDALRSALSELCAAARWATGDKPSDQAALQNALGKANTLLADKRQRAEAGR